MSTAIPHRRVRLPCDLQDSANRMRSPLGFPEGLRSSAGREQAMRWTKPFGLLLVVASVMVYAYVFNLRNVSAGSPSLSGGNAEVLSSSLIKVDRLDASADRIIPADARLEKIADGFTWVEGPIWVKDSLFFAEIPSDSIRKWTPGAGVRIFLKPS